MARPTKYKAKFVKTVDAYVDECFNDENKIPWIEEIAMKIGVDVDTITNWEKEKNEQKELKYPKFFGSIKRLMTLQRLRLKQKGMAGKIRATMPIFLLKANHEMVETDRHELTGKNGQKLANGFTIYERTIPTPKPAVK